MNTSQLTCVLNCDSFLKHVERGVLAVDQLQKASIQQYPSAYIVNTDPSSKRGNHWIAFYFDANKNGEFFDSYGNSPRSYSQTFLNFLLQNADKYQYNDRKLQSDHSTVCGQFSAYYLMFKARGYSMQEIVDSLSFDNSDHYVYDLFKNVFYM